MAETIVLRNASLLDGKIVDIGTHGHSIRQVASPGQLQGDRYIDCNGGLCVRPLTETHLHLDKAGTAMLAEHVPATIPEAIETMAAVKRATAHDAEGLYERMRATLKNIRKHGTCFIRVLVDVDDTWGLTAFNAAKDLRTEFQEQLYIKIEVFPQDGLTPTVADLLREAAAKGADGIGAHTDIDDDYRGAVGTAAEIARTAGLSLQVHVDEPASPSSFKLPEVLDIAGDAPKLVLAHCLSLATLPNDEQDKWIERLLSSGAHVAVAPSVLSFGLPLAPVAKLIAAGVPTLIATDNLQDVFVPLGTGRLLDAARTVALTQRLIDPEVHKSVVAAITNRAYALVTGEKADIAADTSASLMVFSGNDARSVICGDDETQLVMINGTFVEERGS